MCERVYTCVVCVCVCVCVRVLVCVRVCVCVCVHMHVHAHVGEDVYVCVRVGVRRCEQEHSRRRELQGTSLKKSVSRDLDILKRAA